MSEKGTYVCRSGNVMEWEIFRSGDRIAVKGCFRDDPPSPQDEAEADAYVDSLMPRDARFCGADMIPDSQIQVALDRFLGKGSIN